MGITNPAYDESFDEEKLPETSEDIKDNETVLKETNVIVENVDKTVSESDAHIFKECSSSPYKEDDNEVFIESNSSCDLNQQRGKEEKYITIIQTPSSKEINEN